MEQYKKQIIYDKRAYKEYLQLPLQVRVEFDLLFERLAHKGKLERPEAKKLIGTELFELRVKKLGAWRCFYAYVKGDQIVALGFLHKKTQKTAKKELFKSQNRLNNYL